MGIMQSKLWKYFDCKCLSCELGIKKPDIKIYEHCLNQLSLKPEECGIRELQGEFAVDNPGSGRVMEKLGMSFLQDTEYTKWDGSATFKAKIYSSLGQNGTKHI